MYATRVKVYQKSHHIKIEFFYIPGKPVIASGEIMGDFQGAKVRDVTASRQK
jgi:hypothetical protein